MIWLYWAWLVVSVIGTIRYVHLNGEYEKSGNTGGVISSIFWMILFSLGVASAIVKIGALQ